MAIETSDLNDKDILSNTVQINGGPGGAIKFKYTLSDGHVLTSEWIGEDHKKKAAFMWVEAVKNQAAARSQEREEEILAKAKRERDAKKAQELVLPPGVSRAQYDDDEPARQGGQAILESVEQMGAAVRGSPGPGTTAAQAAILQQLQAARKQVTDLEQALELLRKLGV